MTRCRVRDTGDRMPVGVKRRLVRLRRIPRQRGYLTSGVRYPDPSPPHRFVSLSQLSKHPGLIGCLTAGGDTELLTDIIDVPHFTLPHTNFTLNFTLTFTFGSIILKIRSHFQIRKSAATSRGGPGPFKVPASYP